MSKKRRLKHQQLSSALNLAGQSMGLVLSQIERNAFTASRIDLDQNTREKAKDNIDKIVDYHSEFLNTLLVNNES